jgi:bifunctional DNA-binding transcriptional regulator/antitoxin component of YhaV-PrlF toxin-antitoxin module
MENMDAEKNETKTFLAKLRTRRTIIVPPEYVEALSINEGDLLTVTVGLERRRNNDDKEKQE